MQNKPKIIHKKSKYRKNKNINHGYYDVCILIFYNTDKKTDLSATLITQKHNTYTYKELIT